MSDLNIKLNLDTNAAESNASQFKSSVDEAKKDIEKPAKINIDVGDSLTRMADSFNEIRGAISGFASMINDTVTGFAALADEQNRLSAQSARLNLDFDAAASAAGRFVDETSAMTVATQFAARGINLTQVQLNDLMHVAAATAQTLGTSVATEANNLTEALIRGRSNALAPFGEAFVTVSGHGHTLNERLGVLRTTAEQVATATDNATTSMERFQDSIDDAKRTFATAFVNELQRMSELGRETNQVATDLDEVNINLRAAGSTAANVVTQLTLGIQGVGAIAYLAVAPVIDLVNLAMAATHGMTALSRETNRIASSGRSIEALRMVEQIGNRLEALQNDTGRSAATGERPPNVPIRPRRPATEDDDDVRTRRTAAIHAETEAQMRAGAEAVRIAEQHRLDAQNGISLTERRERAQEILSAAINETTRASEAMEQGHQTPAQRSSLVTALNAETVARHEVSAAIAAQSTAISQLVDSEVARAQAFENKARLETDRASIEAEADRVSAGDKQRQNDSLAQQHTYGGRMRALLHEEVDAKKELASATVMGFNAMGSALAKHAQAFAQGKEDVGDALQGMLKDVLTSIGSEAMIKGAMMMAEGAAALAGIYTAPLAAGNFAAGAAFFGVGAMASAAGAAIPAAASSGGGGKGGGGGGGAAARSETPNRSTGSSDQAPKNITINMNAFQSNESAQALIVRSLREAGYAGRNQVGMSMGR